MKSTNVTSMAEWKCRESAELIEYLQARMKLGDLDGLVVQSIDRRGKERVYMTGVYKRDPTKALSACLALSMKMAVAEADDA